MDLPCGFVCVNYYSDVARLYMDFVVGIFLKITLRVKCSLLVVDEVQNNDE